MNRIKNSGLVILVIAGGICLLCMHSCGPGQTSEKDYAKFVNPFIGTAANGHTYPGATAPFGMVQVSPETGNIGWEYCSGYHYEDSTIMGFAHTHLSGTGWMDLGDILLMPFTGDTRKGSYKSSFSHTRESASPGYYSVYLDDYDIQAELTATQRTAFHSYTFKKAKEGHLLIDLKHGIVPTAAELETHVLKSGIQIGDSHFLSGFTITQGWAGEKHIYFAMEFEQPVVSLEWLTPPEAERNQQLILSFNKESGIDSFEVAVKVGLSTVSVENAMENLRKEIPGWDFNTTKQEARVKWNQHLNRIDIEGDARQKTIFYTTLYHTLVTPNNITDADSSYRGADNRVYKSESGAYYSTLSLWDTYRATHPFYTLLCPERVSGMVAGMIRHYEVQGYLPIWTLWGHENFCMIGNHAIPVIVDAYQKGIRGYDVNKAYEAVKASSEVSHPKSNWDVYLQYDYLPSDIIKEEAVSRTLESEVDDWCVAQMAKALGKQEDYAEYTRRAGFYRNLFDHSVNLTRGKNTDGSWVTPFDPFKISHAGDAGGDYTEGNAWQYTWHVMQDVDGLIGLMGGVDVFTAKLDSLFLLEPKVYGDGLTVDVTGLIGQYVHGNEPCHHVAYLYNYAGQPWKTQEKINQITTTLYNETPGGLCGNDDCGQMSAWYIFSSLGFYPVNPADGKYVFGKPMYRKATLNPGNKPFVIEAKNLSSENIYIQGIELNRKPYYEKFITHQDIIKGGHLIFTMGPKPKLN
ncbi:MAG: GH92 family glycosyl hydrolase [Bacteroidales bacterium]|nr:GH92 family glycosyl hydrolase [Bacteroidales bacterium]